MARESVDELWEGRRATLDSERQKRYTRVFHVRTDDPLNGADVAAAPGGTPDAIPDVGWSHPDEPFAFCVSVDPATTSEDPTLWVVTAEYDTRIPKGQAAEALGFDDDGESAPNEVPNNGPGGDPVTGSPGQREENPLERPWVWRLGRETAQEVVMYDRNGDVITNSAKEPYDPPIVREVTYPVWTLSRNEEEINFTTVEQYQDAVNSAEWRGYAAGKCKLSIEAESGYENGVKFWRVVYTIKVRWKGWRERLIDRGYRELINPGSEGDPEYKVIRSDDKLGTLPAEPMLLDGFGQKLAPGEEPVLLDPVQIYRELPYAELGI